jgi:hypothetical protein
MIDRQTIQSISSIKDSYLSEEIDPNKTNAIESSLWEIEVEEFEIILLFLLYNSLDFDSSSSSRCSNMCSCTYVSSKHK